MKPIFQKPVQNQVPHGQAYPLEDEMKMPKPVKAGGK